MIRVDSFNAPKVHFKSNLSTSKKEQTKKEQEQKILQGSTALLMHSATIGSRTQEILKELQQISSNNYPSDRLNQLENRTLDLLKEYNLPLASEFTNPPLSIWGDLYLTLQNEKQLDDKTKLLIQNDISNVVMGKTSMKEVINPTVWSVSYEYTNPVGGQTDIAREQPVAMNNAGVKTLAVSPMFNITHNGKALNFLENTPDGLIYHTPNAQTPVEKVYEGELKSGDKTNKFQVYYGEYGPHKQPTLFLYDNDLYDFGDVKNPMVYQNLEHSNERVRMAQFNNMTYELLAQAKDGKVNLPTGAEIEAPDKLIAHEAWQSGGLISKMRLYSRVEDQEHSRPMDTTQYLRDLANNTAVIVHNLGNGYQGQEGSAEVMQDYFNTLYNDYSKDVVENSLIGKPNDEIGLYATPSQRLGFYENVLNPAHGAVTLATKIGPVSSGYKDEMIQDGISVKLDSLVKVKDKYGSLTAFPNGVDKKPLSATSENVNKINIDFKEKLDELLEGSKVNAYASDLNDIENINLVEFSNKKTNNKKIFTTLLKDAAKNNNEATPLIHGVKAPAFYEGEFGIDISNINENTPIFSMASRLDSQKGFDTMVDAYAKLVENKEIEDSDFPVLVISGSGDEGLSNYIKNKKDELGELGQKILFTQGRISNSGLLLMNMTTANSMPSDFEPYGISELKGLYAGSAVIATEVGGMKSSGEISRKIYSHKDYDTDRANAVTVKDYEFMCIANDWEKEDVRDRNSSKLKDAMQEYMNLSKKDLAKMDLNALKTDVSWDKGAIDNYLDVMKIKTE